MTTTQTHAAQVLTDAETDQHLDAVLNGAGSALRHYTTEFSLSRMRAAMREHEAAILAKLQPAQAGELPEPELGYIKTDKSNQPAYSARQMRAALAARKPLSAVVLGESMSATFPGSNESSDGWFHQPDDPLQLAASLRRIAKEREQEFNSTFYFGYVADMLETCPHCHGSGLDEETFEACTKCNGTGKRDGLEVKT